MGIEDSVLRNLRSLPPEKQQEVLDFVEFLHLRSGGRHRARSIKGLCADLGLHVDEREIAEAREEIWGRFPREDL